MAPSSSTSSSSSPDLTLELDTALFREPADYFRPPLPHTFTTYTLHSGQTLSLRLVGHNPLWGHHLWNAASSITTYLQHPPHTTRLLTHQRVLELGAGAGLPSLAASLLGASHVVVTDYPDAELLENLSFNIHHSGLSLAQQSRVSVAGHAFGAPATDLLSDPNSPSPARFDTLILADLLFNHHCHAALLLTVRSTLARTPDARALVFFTPYRPWLLHKDMAFFEIAREGGMVVQEVGQEMAAKVMFGEDEGVSRSSAGVSTRVVDAEWKDETLRKTIFQYELRWKEEELEKVEDRS